MGQLKSKRSSVDKVTADKTEDVTTEGATPEDYIQRDFSDYARHLELEDERHPIYGGILPGIFTHLRNVERGTREVVSALNDMHTAKGIRAPSAVASRARKLLGSEVISHLSRLAAATPQQDFYKWQSISSAMRRLSFCAMLIRCLESKDLVLLSQDQTQAALQIKPDSSEDLHLVLEDYLGGVVLLAHELTRYVFSCAILGDDWAQRLACIRVYNFLNRLLGGFCKLNLESDALREMFDSLKRDVEKVEQVAYDLSIRMELKWL